MKYQLENSILCNKILAESSKNTLFTHPLSKQYKDIIYEETNMFPANINFSYRIIAIATQNECKCKNCEKIHGKPQSSVCSLQCLYAFRKKNAISLDKKAYENSANQKRRDAKLKNGVEGIDYMICQICNSMTAELGSHIRMHDISMDEYKEKYNVSTLKTEKQLESVRGKNNPGYNHQGKLSAWSKNFKNGFDQDRLDQNIERHKQFLKTSPEKFPSFVEYWIEKNNGDVEEGTNQYLQFQRKDLANFIRTYGVEDGTKRHAEKIEKWMKSFKKCNYSKISQLLFREVVQHIDTTHVYFATYDRPDMEEYINKEYFLKLKNSIIRPDFIDTNLMKIIEFDGDYWHSDARANPLRESTRDDRIFECGYEVLHVKEHEYKNNKEKVIRECLTFLTQ